MTPNSSDETHAVRCGAVISLTAEDAAKATGIGKSTLYAAARAGDLEVRWVGRQKFVIEPDELRAWVRTLPTAKPGPVEA